MTYDHVSARSSLVGEEMVPGYGPSTRNLPNALRNALLARRLYDDLAPDVVVSSGAGIAVPFLMIAARRGIEAHYIESATRTHEPSLTGRILERVAPRVTLHAQYASWRRAGWGHCQNVFADFVLDRDERRGSGRGLRILVTVGSKADFPFPALITHVARLVEPGDEIYWQVGSSPAPPPREGHEVVDFISYERMTALLAAVDVVIAHAGVGTALSALLAGRRPVLVPRRHARGEHVDDHQVALGSELAAQGLALVRELEQLRRDDLEEAAAWSAHRRRSDLTETEGPADLSARTLRTERQVEG